MRIAIIVEGGFVQSVVTDDPDLARKLQIAIVDYDTDGADDDDIVSVKQSDGTEADAAVHPMTCDLATVPFTDIFGS